MVAGGPDRAERVRVALALYGQVNTNFRKLTDIRFKLLAFLPLATGLASLTKLATENPAFSLFAAVITLGLWVYDQRNNEHYDELVSQAASLERTLGFFGGPFDARPGRTWDLLAPATDDTPSRKTKIFVEHRWPINLIYGASFTVWLSSAVAPVAAEVLMRNELFVQVAMTLIVADCVWVVLKSVLYARELRDHELRRSAIDAYKQLTDFLGARVLGPYMPRVAVEDITALIQGWRWNKDHHAARLFYYCENLASIEPSLPGEPRKLAALMLGQISNLPPRWIEDISGRRSVAAPEKPSWLGPLGVGALATFALCAVVIAGKPSEKMDLAKALATDIRALMSEAPKATVTRPEGAPKAPTGVSEAATPKD